MIVAALLLQLTAHAASPPVIAPRRPQPTAYRKLPSRTSRVRAWTIEQRICEKRTKSSCVMSAPDLVQAEADKPRERP